MEGEWGEVLSIQEETSQIQYLQVKLHNKEEPISAIHYLHDNSPCYPGCRVAVNTSALELNLGTGGFGFVMAIAPSKKDASLPIRPAYPGHIMKLRYTPQQTPILAVEAPESEYHHTFQSDFSLAGKNVILGELHSMLPIIASMLHNWRPASKLVYIMDDQASLYLSMSRHIHYLKQRMDLVTISYGQALMGDIEAINLFTALEAAVKISGADHIVITQGPGVVGTGTIRGFSGMQLLHWLHTVHSLGGEAMIIPRIHFQDQRERHIGISQHTLYPLQHHALAGACIAYPYQEGDPRSLLIQEQLQPLLGSHDVRPVAIATFHQEVLEALKWYNHPILTMGRDFEADPYFFYAVGALFHLYQTASD